MDPDKSEAVAPIQPDFALFQAFAVRADVIFWVADPVSFQLVYVSPHAEGVLGLLLADWLRPSFWQDHLHPSDRERVLAEFAKAVVSQETYLFDYRLQAADRSPLWFRDRVCLLPNSEPPLLCGLMTDVTAFKTAVNRQTATPGYTSIFLEVVTLLSNHVDFKQSLTDLALRLCEIFDVTAVQILEWDPDWGIATQLAQYHTNDAPVENNVQRKSLSELIDSLGGRINPEPIVFSVEDPALTEWAQINLKNHQAQTILYVPLLGANVLLGCIELIESRVPRHFSPYDIELSQVIAQQTAIAFTRVQLFQAEARRRREAEILLDVAEFVSSSLDLDEILTRVIEILRVYLTDVHNCYISLISDDGLYLDTIASWWSEGKFGYMHKGARVEISNTFTSQLAIKQGEPIVISDLKEIPFTNDFTFRMAKQGLRSILCIPIKIQGKTVGTLHINHWHEPRRFFAEEVALLQGVVNQAAIAIENARLFANERRQLQLSRTLQKVGALLTTSLQLDQVYEQIFDLLGQVVEFDSASLFLVDKASDNFVMVAARGFERPLFENGQLRLPTNSVAQKIDQPPGWAVIQDVLEHPAWITKDGLESIRAWIGALLLVKGDQIGLLCVDSAVAGHYSAEDGQTVAAFANQAAVAIENARLYDETMRQAKELAILNQVSQESAVSLNIDLFLENITNIISEEFHPEIFGFIMFDEETNELRSHYSCRGLTEEMKQAKIPLEHSVIGHVVLTGQPYYAPNVVADPYYFSPGKNLGSELAVPLKVNHEVIGVINVESSEMNAFSSRDLAFFMTLAGNIAAVLERARLYETLQIQAASLAEQVSQRTRELKMERDRLFAILESAGEGIILTDTQAHILYANPAMERQSGYSRSELQLQNPRILGSSQVPKSVFTEMWHQLLEQKRWVGELVNQHKDGYVYDVVLAVTPISDATGEVTGYVSVQSDITRLKELERLKTEFIANASHQLRTPLTNIKTYVSLLSKGKPEKFPRYFSVLHYEIDRLARLIQDLLDISRLDAEVAPNPDAATDFVDFWEMFWPSFMERAERENRVLHVLLPDDVAVRTPIVYMGTYQLEKLLSRLVENAFMYADETGEIRVSVNWLEMDTPALELKVCDDGPGIPEGERPYIFDRFFRGAQAVEASLPGNGLGLAIVKELLVQYGGQISLESEVGVGSCFVLHLPLVKQPISNGEPDDAR